MATRPGKRFLYHIVGCRGLFRAKPEIVFFPAQGVHGIDTKVGDAVGF